MITTNWLKWIFYRYASPMLGAAGQRRMAGCLIYETLYHAIGRLAMLQSHARRESFCSEGINTNRLYLAAGVCEDMAEKARLYSYELSTAGQRIVTLMPHFITDLYDTDEVFKDSVDDYAALNLKYLRPEQYSGSVSQPEVDRALAQLVVDCHSKLDQALSTSVSSTERALFPAP